MSILYDEFQRTIAHESRRLLEARTDDALLLSLLERTGEYDAGCWQAGRDQGWCGVAAPVEEGGLGLGLLEMGLILEAHGAVAAGCPFVFSGYAAMRALLAGNNREARQHWMPRLVAGDAIGTLAFAEANSPLPAAPSTTYVEGRLSGVKTGVVAGLHAHCAVVWASTGQGPALIWADLGGVDREPVESFDNSRGYANLRMSGVPGVVLLSGDHAQGAASDLLARLAVLAAHEQVGGAEKLLHVARDYANLRKAFGQPIGAFQSVKHRLAELYGLVEIARANAIHAASIEGGADFKQAAAAARISAIEAYDTAARDAVQIHGGAGVVWNSSLQLHMRRARSLAIEAGNLYYWEDVLAECLTGVTQ